MRHFFFFLFLSSSILLLTHCQNSSNSTTEIDSAGNVVISGQKVFKQYCVLCHGADGKKGLNNAADLTKSTMSDMDRIEIITHGRNLMTPFRGILTSEEIEAVAEYTKELSDG